MKTVSIVPSSAARWYKPRFHVTTTNDAGLIDETWIDLGPFEAVFFALYYVRRGWKLS